LSLVSALKMAGPLGRSSLGYCWQIRVEGEMALDMSDKFMVFEN
jgi:hypothetical protein